MFLKDSDGGTGFSTGPDPTSEEWRRVLLSRSLFFLQKVPMTKRSALFYENHTYSLESRTI